MLIYLQTAIRPDVKNGMHNYWQFCSNPYCCSSFTKVPVGKMGSGIAATPLSIN